MAGRIVSREGAALRLDTEGGVGRRTDLITKTPHLALIALLGAGASSLVLPAAARDFPVSSALGLANAINQAANDDTITFRSDITLTSNLPAVSKSVTIQGAGWRLSGDNLYRGFIVGDPVNPSIKPAVTINNLTIVDALAKGGDGGDGGYLYASNRFGGAGGGGAGLGGGLLVLAGANLAITNVTFQNNRAQGGNGGGNVGASAYGAGGGGGGYLSNGASGDFRLGGRGGAGGGGNGGGTAFEAAQIEPAPSQPGGFGGGGGGRGLGNCSGACPPGGAGSDGGFGGGGGGGNIYTLGQNGIAKGGFGGGDSISSRAGGGAGLGGAIFVQQGGRLVIDGDLSVSGGAALGGAGSVAAKGQGADTQGGQGYGSGLFLQGSGLLVVAPGAGQLQTIADAIVDQTGLVGAGGSWGIQKNGAGTTILAGKNAYSGQTFVAGGMLLLGSSDSLPGSSAVTLNGGMIGSSAGTIVVSNPISIGPFAGTGFYAAAGTNLSLGGVVSGARLIKAGAGDVTLAAANTFKGATITGGVLRFNTDNNLGEPGDIVINGGSVGSTPATPPGTAISRDLSLVGNGGIDVANAALTWSGSISGSGQFIKSGAGELHLTAPPLTPAARRSRAEPWPSRPTPCLARAELPWL
jgi:autotransporter-associated beta strand protein